MSPETLCRRTLLRSYPTRARSKAAGESQRPSKRHRYETREQRSNRRREREPGPSSREAARPAQAPARDAREKRHQGFAVSAHTANLLQASINLFYA